MGVRFDDSLWVVLRSAQSVVEHLQVFFPGLETIFLFDHE